MITMVVHLLILKLLSQPLLSIIPEYYKILVLLMVMTDGRIMMTSMITNGYLYLVVMMVLLTSKQQAELVEKTMLMNGPVCLVMKY